jgi:DNA-binding NarL/FixJ family response regulator
LAAGPGQLTPDVPHILRVLLVEDHRIFRKSLAERLREEPDIEIVGEAGDGEEAVRAAERLHPDVVVMDVTIPKLNGIEATERITHATPSIRVIAYTMHSASDMSASMRGAGAVEFVCKDEPFTTLLTAIRSGV